MKIDQQVLEIIANERVSVLAVPFEDSNHTSALLYSYKTDPLELYYMTQAGSLKTKELSKSESPIKSSLVIGVTENGKFTLQMHGFLSVVNNSQLNAVKELHYQRFPKSIPFESDDTLFMKFVPTWWRYTDYQVRPPVVTSSHQL